MNEEQSEILIEVMKDIKHVLQKKKDFRLVELESSKRLILNRISTFIRDSDNLTNEQKKYLEDIEKPIIFSLKFKLNKINSKVNDESEEENVGKILEDAQDAKVDLEIDEGDEE